ncbi:sodium:calcium antiporter [Limisalsivibrio acetivorans]|uniref:sodium:calcium antiporter n=1 Tax=Limisalsivibrio acetivorans TaxID=1304888 RepID=UPI0003B43DF2|nr:sodium:calcium antiporter [Limisalsivibrio acetivorans]
MDILTASAVFIISTAVIAVSGTYLAKTSDELADVTGMGEAVFGAVLLGGTTSLPGIITSVTAAYSNHPELAVSNAIGGIAAQTFFLSIADISYRKTNLEHAAASFPNLMQGTMLIALLSLVMAGIAGPSAEIFHFHPFSLLIIIFYIGGSKLVSKAKDEPMWRPRLTRETVEDEPDIKNIRKLSMKALIIKFVLLAAVVGTAGYSVAESGIIIADKTGLSESLVGALFTAVATSLPELIVSVAAVRYGALTMAVGNIIGGNTFDVMFVAFADFAYLEGSILQAVTMNQVYMIAMTILMTGVLIMGLLHREEQGLGKIGWESSLIFAVYILGNAFLFFLT